MLQVISKWRVVVSYGGDRAPVVLYISDNFLSNALRTLASLEFSENRLEQPTSIQVSLEAR
jgi:hypothetical protein